MPGKNLSNEGPINGNWMLDARCSMLVAEENRVSSIEYRVSSIENMEIIAHGIDLVDCPRIEKMIKQHGERFINRVFTAAEQNYAEGKKDRIEKLAGRFAAKEAVLKLMGTGWRGKIAWTDIEILNNAAGQPEVTLSGEVEKLAEKLGINHISVSITHTANFVIASAIALAQSDEEK